jgi:cytochrome c biogenesis protein CcmG/thiol:disulfide interchange protein DsbE
MRRRLLILAATAAFFAVPCLPCPAASAPSDAPSTRPPAPEFTLRDANGQPIALSAYRGKVVVVDVWATWCTGCKIEIPWFIAFQKKYARRGLVTIGVAMDDEGWATVTPYLRRKPIAYPVVVSDAAFAGAFNVTSLPMTLLIDREGRIADAHVGMVTRSAWEHELQMLLQER